jgi:hypothetical protein
MLQKHISWNCQKYNYLCKMTRQDYIRLKQTNPTELIYIYYKDKFNGYKHKPELSRNELMMYVQMYNDVNSILNYVVQEYDRKFDIVLLMNTNGQYIKSL